MGDSLWNYMWMLKSHGIFKQHLSPHLMLILKIKLIFKLEKGIKEPMLPSRKAISCTWEENKFVYKAEALALPVLSPGVTYSPLEAFKASQFAYFLMVTYPWSQGPSHTQPKGSYIWDMLTQVRGTWFIIVTPQRLFWWVTIFGLL